MDYMTNHNLVFQQIVDYANAQQEEKLTRRELFSRCFKELFTLNRKD